ncbi:hypothetical protein ACPD8N_01340 [Lacticaseibacillus chiayiensis]|uniref:Uncharacterized protein n=1 Tax=Lacticaseibacillus chiayiensis TaxID=2100821 RepID=A0ABY6H941_9LACO|nr:hypothetical protein [Lacticaseibacillus chiayiensis]QVI36090.1 hypothetical protein KG086_01310 [Lacticaseibacillus chiayiensis]UYN57891.1 hypothetical protein OFW50_01410 [Lacticaseibacillus chiayiensis]
MTLLRYFVANGEGFVRLNIGMPRPLLKEALDRILATYAKWPLTEKAQAAPTPAEK